MHQPFWFPYVRGGFTQRTAFLEMEYMRAITAVLLSSTMATIGLALIFTAHSSAQLEYRGQTLSTPGVLTVGSISIWWPGGPTAVIVNGDLHLPVQVVVFDPTEPVTIDNRPVVPVLDPSGTLPLMVDYGTGIVLAPHRWSPDPVQAPVWYLQGGTTVVPALADLQPLLDDWGPSPDPRKTNYTGSGRLMASRVPGAMANTLELQRGGQTDMTAAVRWVAEQWQRGYHLYTLDGNQPLWWTADDWPTLLPYQGYSNSHGGPSTLYGAVRPPGVTWDHSGWPAPDPDHFAIDQSCLAAWMLNWPVAAIDAGTAMETGIATARREESSGGRGHGHLIRGIATYAMINPVRAHAMMVEHLPRLEARNFGVYVVLDKGNSTDASHMPPANVQWISDALNFDAAMNKQLAKSASSFMVGIVVLGCDLALRVPQFWADADLRPRLWHQMELGTFMLVGPSRGFAINTESQTFGVPDDGVMWDDVAPAILGFSIQRAEGGSHSVAPRFIAPALAAYYVRTSDSRALEALRDVSTSYGLWTQDWLEVWPMSAVYGFDP